MGNDKFNNESYTYSTAYKNLTNFPCEEMVADKKAAYLPLVYICSPYAGDIETNVMYARKYSRFAVDNDVIPITPHLMYPQFMDDTDIRERRKVMHFNYVLLGKCSEVWVFGGVVSRGMAKEIDVAKKRKMKIRWFTRNMREVGKYD